MPTQWNRSSLPLQSRTSLRLEFPAYHTGVRIEIPFTAIVGRAREPRLLLIAGVHGDEYEGVASLIDLAQELDPNNIEGTLTIVPVANPQAFDAGTRRNPVDFGDLNRSFPGDPSGSLSSRLAHLLFEELVLGNDCLLSLHGWSREATVMPYGEYPKEQTEAGRKSQEAALATGLEYFHPYDWPRGVLGEAALPHGIAAVETEVGGMGTVTGSGQETTKNLIYGFLRYWGVLPHEQAPAAKMHKIVDHIDLFADHAGLFRTVVETGQAVQKGKLLGTIHALDGHLLAELRAPDGGVIAILRTFASVQPGDRLIQIFVDAR
jgi:N-alpha-acetyl-L-2,4-diaminobutyrate deacetylase